MEDDGGSGGGARVFYSERTLLPVRSHFDAATHYATTTPSTSNAGARVPSSTTETATSPQPLSGDEGRLADDGSVGGARGALGG